jgi:hypothetical protein
MNPVFFELAHSTIALKLNIQAILSLLCSLVASTSQYLIEKPGHCSKKIDIGKEFRIYPHLESS